MRSIIEIFGGVGVSLDGGMWYRECDIPKWTHFKDELPPYDKDLLLRVDSSVTLATYYKSTKKVHFRDDTYLSPEHLDQSAWIVADDILRLPVRD